MLGDGNSPHTNLAPRTDADIVEIEDIPQAGQYVVACFIAVAAYNAIELLFIVLFTFLRYSGLYFWAILIATAGVLVSAIGLVVRNWSTELVLTLSAALNNIGWVLMVSGQSFVLFSRLHLINTSQRFRRWVLTMLIVNAIMMHTPTTVLEIGSKTSHASKFAPGYAYAERTQVTVFFAQELVLSGIYMWKSVEVLRYHRNDGQSDPQKQLGRIILHLFLVNLLVVALDITILVLQFGGLYVIQVSYKAFAYSVKLKCEIGILNRLVDFVKTTRPESFCLTSQLEREWEMTLRMTFGNTNDDSTDRWESPSRSRNPPRSDQVMAGGASGLSTGMMKAPAQAQLPQVERRYVPFSRTQLTPSSPGEDGIQQA